MTIQIYEFNLDQQKKELEIRGTPMFPCAAYHSDIVNNVTKDIPWHWHEEIEVIVIKKGTIQIGVNGQYLTLKEGEGIFINSNVLHAAKVLEDGTYLLNSLVFHSSLISGGTESIFEQRYVRPLLLCEQIPYLLFNHSEMWHHEAIQCTENAYDTYEKMNYGYELLIRNYLSNLWYLISIHAQPIISKSFKYELLDTSRLKLMMNYLHDHYDEPIILTQISNSANISEHECLRCFNKTLGLSPIQYLLKYRISVAARLLVDSQLSITEICQQVGFDSPSYFSKIFKRFLNCTPTQYRLQRTR